MKLSELFVLSVIFLLLSFIDSKINLFLLNNLAISNLVYLFFCYICFKNPQKINSFFGAYIGFLLDLHQNVFFGLHASLFTLTVIIINYNYFRFRMFSALQITVSFSLLTTFFVGFRSIFLTTMNFQYLVIFLSFLVAFVSYLLIVFFEKLFLKKNLIHE